MSALATQWHDTPQLRQIKAAFGAAQDQLFFFGGALRDTRAGITPVDVDLVTNLTLQENMQKLQMAGFTPTIASEPFGAIKLSAGHLQLDVHSLRAPMYEGWYDPQASLETNLKGYLQLSDFTLNAIACDVSGKLYDPFAGVADLAAGRVRFINPPMESIAGSPIQIVRFFRFFAWFGRTEPEIAALEACARQRHLLAGQLGWKRYKAFKPLLTAPAPGRSLELMQKHHCLHPTLGFGISTLSHMQALEALEKKRGEASAFHVRLALLLLSAALPFKDACRSLIIDAGLPTPLRVWLMAVAKYLPQLENVDRHEIEETIRQGEQGTYNELLLLRQIMQ